MLISLVLATGIFVSDSQPDFKAMFAGYEGCFYAKELRSGRTLIHNEVRTRKRFPPCSTFKIAHTAIALDSGVANSSEIFKWDGKPKLRDAWSKDQTLEAAVRNSTVWVFEEIAARLGKSRSESYLKRLGYGNQDASGYPGAYWLMSSLKISAQEQVRLVEKLVREQWPLSKSAQQSIESWLLVESGPDYRYYGKTGSGIEGYPVGKMPPPGVEPPQLGWWVGWIESKDGTWVFAANYSGKDAMGIRLQPKVRKGWVQMGILPPLSSK